MEGFAGMGRLGNETVEEDLAAARAADKDKLT